MISWYEMKLQVIHALLWKALTYVTHKMEIQSDLGELLYPIFCSDIHILAIAWKFHNKKLNGTHLGWISIIKDGKF